MASQSWETAHALVDAAPLTLLLAVIAVVPGALIAFGLTALRYSRHAPLRWLARVYVDAVRATPLLLLLYFVYYGLPELSVIRHTALWSIFKHSMWCAGIALGINASAYASEVFRAAVASVPRGAVIAAKASGMSSWMQLRRVTLPLALRQGLPAYSNEVIEMVKATSLVSTITIFEISGTASLQISLTLATVSTYLMAGVLYLLINGTLTVLFTIWERSLTTGFDGGRRCHEWRSG